MRTFGRVANALQALVIVGLVAGLFYQRGLLATAHAHVDAATVLLNARRVEDEAVAHVATSQGNVLVEHLQTIADLARAWAIDGEQCPVLGEAVRAAARRVYDTTGTVTPKAADSAGRGRP